jgi:hypothetical protein
LFDCDLEGGAVGGKGGASSLDGQRACVVVVDEVDAAQGGNSGADTFGVGDETLCVGLYLVGTEVRGQEDTGVVDLYVEGA